MSHFRYLRLSLLLFVVALFAPCFAQKIADIKATNYVTDLAGVIDANTAARINALAGEVERKTGAQIAVVTVRSLDGDSVEDYAVDLFKHLGIGHKDDRGVLLLVAPSDRKYRVEVGYGLEPIINDARAGDIGRAMVPYLRQGDYDSAIALGSGQLATLIAKASNVQLDQAPPTVRARETDPAVSANRALLLLVLIVVGGGAILVLVIWALSKAGSSGGSWGSGSGGFGGGWGSGSDWGSSSGGWGGSSGGGFDFGGFGGGSSGGGGASGSW